MARSDEKGLPREQQLSVTALTGAEGNVSSWIPLPSGLGLEVDICSQLHVCPLPYVVDGVLKKNLTFFSVELHLESGRDFFFLDRGKTVPVFLLQTRICHGIL